MLPASGGVDDVCGFCNGLCENVRRSLCSPNEDELYGEEAKARAMRLRKMRLDAKNGTTPSPQKVSSMMYSFSPVKLQRAPDMFDINIREQMTEEEANVLKRLSSTEPGVLAGYQIKDSKSNQVYVVLGIRSQRLYPTEFCLCSAENGQESWLRLNRKGNSDGIDFRVLRRVISLS